MEENPLVAARSPKQMIRASFIADRKARVNALLAYYEKKPAPAVVAVAKALDRQDLELLMLVLGIDGQFSTRVTRNHYVATLDGANHRRFQALERRGLVTLFAQGGSVACRVTDAGIDVVEQGITAAIAATNQGS